MKCAEYDESRNIAKTHYYTNKVNDCLNNEGSIFVITNKVLHCSTLSPLPTYNDPAVLANNFAAFFNNKILKIYKFLSSRSELSQPTVSDLEPAASVHLTEFKSVDLDDGAKIMDSAPVKSYPLDLILSKGFKGVSKSLLPILTKIVNLSLSTSEVLTILKETMINPILKKVSLIKEL